MFKVSSNIIWGREGERKKGRKDERGFGGGGWFHTVSRFNIGDTSNTKACYYGGLPR
jgi:hypothetical protein